MRGDVLVVVICVLYWHPGRAASWRDNRPFRERETDSDDPSFKTICDQASSQAADN